MFWQHHSVLHCGLCVSWDGDIQGFINLVSAAMPVWAESLVRDCGLEEELIYSVVII